MLLSAAAGYGGRQLDRLGDRLFDAAVQWVLRHRDKKREVVITLYGPNGEPLRDVVISEEDTLVDRLGR